MYKTVYDLTREELDELKEAYYWDYENYWEEGDEDHYESWKDVPDDVVFGHYDGISFTSDDFFYNQKGDNE